MDNATEMTGGEALDSTCVRRIERCLRASVVGRTSFRASGETGIGPVFVLNPLD